MISIALVGKPGSGKSTAASYLSEKYGYKIINLGDVVKKEAEKLGLNGEDKIVLQKIGKRLREKEGKDIIAKNAIKILYSEYEKSINSSKYIFVGIRNIEEIFYLKRTFGNSFKLISIEASVSIRRRRLQERDGLSLKNFMEREQRDIGLGITESLKIADFRITNNGSKQLLYEQLDEVMRLLLHQ